jgi:hypothetical protein
MTFFFFRCCGIDCECGDREGVSGLLLFLHGVVRRLYMFMLCRFGDVEVLVRDLGSDQASFRQASGNTTNGYLVYSARISDAFMWIEI